MKNLIVYLVLLLATNSLHANIGKQNKYSSELVNSSNQERSIFEEDQTELLTYDHNTKSASTDELTEFYTNKNFASGLYNEIQASIMMAEADTEITQDSLKEIFPKKCDVLIDQVASNVRNFALTSAILLEGPRDIKNACSDWDNLTDDDRADFYVALVTSMALAESSCNNKTQNPNATNGTAYGYWQSTRKLSPVKGALWVMQQLEKQIDRSGLLFWANSNLNYWAVLNPKHHAYKVKKMLKKIPACVVIAMNKVK